MQQIYANVSKVMVESRSNSNLLYLPLDKLIQQSGASTPPAATPAPPSEPATGANVDVRSRDGSRSRDRESR